MGRGWFSPKQEKERGGKKSGVSFRWGTRERRRDFGWKDQAWYAAKKRENYEKKGISWGGAWRNRDYEKRIRTQTVEKVRNYFKKETI